VRRLGGGGAVLPYGDDDNDGGAPGSAKITRLPYGDDDNDGGAPGSAKITRLPELDLKRDLRPDVPGMSESPVKTGEILAGKYRVERVLGTGAMGVVVAATHLGLGQLVALKFMRTSHAATKEQTERFLREAKVAVKLRSQHAARVLDVGVLDTGAPYLVMELLEGRDLASLVESGATIAVADAVEYLLHVCEAMGEAHASGIVHRDLKPANLFLTTDTGGAPCVKVLDFGVSKLTGAEMALTGTVQALGSPLYMSPEQMQAARDVDGRSDIWSLGIVLFELLGGRTPFHAETLPELCTKVFFGEPLPLASLRPDVPPALVAVILGCLEKDRARRFQNVAALAAALAPFAAPRARIYADRVAAIQSVEVAVSRPTDVLPLAPSASFSRPASSPSFAQPASFSRPASSPSFSQPASSPSFAQPAPSAQPASFSQPASFPQFAPPTPPDRSGGRTVSLASLPAIGETSAVARSVPLTGPPRRSAGLLVLALSLALALSITALAAVYFGWRSRAAEAPSIAAPSSSIAAPLPSSSGAASGAGADPPVPAMPSGSAPLVDVAPPAPTPPLPTHTTAPPTGPRRAPIAPPVIKSTRPDYEGPRR
jgi:eukaryotic-like serine/threonine-protein kinase